MKQRFDKQSAIDASSRPTYPTELFEFLATLAPQSASVWDCACGNGQVSDGLTNYFSHIIATDASTQQIAHAKRMPGIEYRVAGAEKSRLDHESIDLVTIGQALHWFNFDQFYQEIERILKPNGFIVAFTYGNFRFSEPAFNQALDYLYFDILWQQHHWSHRRRFVDNGYQDIPFPFQYLPTPQLTMTMSVTKTKFYNYLQSWSSVQHYNDQKKEDPIASYLAPRMDKLWLNENTIRELNAPLTILLGKKTVT